MQKVRKICAFKKKALPLQPEFTNKCAPVVQWIEYEFPKL